MVVVTVVIINLTKVIILNIVVKDFGNLFPAMKIYIQKLLSLSAIRQKNGMRNLWSLMLKLSINSPWIL